MQQFVNPTVHLRQFVALAEMHGREAVARAMRDGLEPQAFSADCIAHIMAAHRRIGAEPAALQLTRSADRSNSKSSSPTCSIATAIDGQPKDRTMRARHAHLEALSAQTKLTALNPPFMRENYQRLAHTTADKHWSHLDYFTELLNGETALRDDRRVKRCIRQARFPVLKAVDKSEARKHSPGRLRHRATADANPSAV